MTMRATKIQQAQSVLLQETLDAFDKKAPSDQYDLSRLRPHDHVDEFAGYDNGFDHRLTREHLGDFG